MLRVAETRSGDAQTDEHYPTPELLFQKLSDVPGDARHLVAEETRFYTGTCYATVRPLAVAGLLTRRPGRPRRGSGRLRTHAEYAPQTASNMPVGSLSIQCCQRGNHASVSTEISSTRNPTSASRLPRSRGVQV